MPTTIVPAPFAKAITYNRETRDFDLLLDGQFVGTARSFYEGEERLDAEVYERLRALRVDLADEAAAADEAAEVALQDALRRAANANLDALERLENENADTLGAPEPDEPTPPDDNDLAEEGLRIASPDEAGWTWRNLWVTDAPDEAAELAGSNFTDEADEAAAAYQEAYRSGAQAMDAALDLTCYCELCGGAVLPEDAALVGEQMACGWCAGKAQGIARFVARHGHAPGEPTPAAPSLMDAFTLSDEAWSAAIARYAPTPRRSFIAHELPAFVEELRGLLAYLPDGGVWQSANGDIRLVQAPTRYAAALAAAEHYEAK